MATSNAASGRILRVALRGDAILTNPHWNKGTAFTVNERKQFGLIGRLPYQVNTLDEQCQRAYDQLLSRDTALRKNSFLQSLKEQNTVLFYQLLRRHLRELMPIIYTPTEVRVPCTSKLPRLIIKHHTVTGRRNRELLALVQAE
jgi:malate dehydrogenase (oxaloacetate-decarboxylating)